MRTFVTVAAYAAITLAVILVPWYVGPIHYPNKYRLLDPTPFAQPIQTFKIKGE
jgi:hypothetical protein